MMVSAARAHSFTCSVSRQHEAHTYGIERVYDRVGTPAKFSTEIGSQLPSTVTSHCVVSSPVSDFKVAAASSTRDDA